ncbi:T9SS type A sorting domain-containing protein [Psychroflexus maritimus]|uniref:T9SS type A sorting domain-containing protein n=1 Tax=Psychroflexus maritimus TaxID=2714865 RepID=A0A967DXV1_9FLAO|nr:T9SS type A sorting domain-containing protein [Psychroflexus maritimus]NGZ89105.1 T9SS type A sorting domain-containing protein [Psychroflexus maritimus]
MQFIKITFLLFLVSSFSTTAQDKDWQWAKRGGGNISLTSGSVTNTTGRERVKEVAVDSENNYYFLAEVGSSNVDYDGESVTTYGDNLGYKNIFVFSTNCEGELRWKKSIGGGFNDFANSIKIDENDNIYVAGKTINTATHTPVHFDNDTIKASAMSSGIFDESKKGAFIIKYNQEGDFQWLVEPEAGYENAAGTSLRLYVEPNGNLHYLMFFRQGTHLDGQVVVDSDNDPQTAILRYDTDGNLLSHILLDMFHAEIGGYDYQFVYDSNLSRYYIADTKRNSSDVISINGFGLDSGTQKGFYLAALEEDGEVIWYHESSISNSWTLGDIQLDTNGDIYFTGLANSGTVNTDSFAGFDFIFGGSTDNRVPFLLKLNSDGELIWGTNADLSNRYPGRSIALAGDDVYVGLGMYYNEWDDLIIDGIQAGGQVPDPTILRFNASSGSLQEVIRMPDNVSGQDEIMSIALDLSGNIVMGGHFSSTLLSSHSLPTLFKNGGDSDFFIAKYGTDDCTFSTADFTPTPTSIKMYPNPANNQVFFESDLALEQVKVFNITGKQVLQANLSQNNNIQVNDLAKGIYLVQIQTQNGQVETRKLVVE